MTIREFIDRVEGSAPTLTLYNVDAPTRALERLAEYFEPQVVDLRRSTTANGLPLNFAVLHDEDRFLAADRLQRIARVVGAGSATTEADLDRGVPDLLRQIGNRTFDGYGKRRMIIASREVETKAYRTGGGRLLAGFQRLSTLRDQRSVYASLVEAGVDVTVHGAPDWEPAIPGLGVVGSEAAEIADSWFVVFDGDGNREDACALVAREVEPNTFTGFWTYDGDVVEDVFGYLIDEYGR